MELYCFRLAVLDCGSSADLKVINYFKHRAGVNSKELQNEATHFCVEFKMAYTEGGMTILLTKDTLQVSILTTMLLPLQCHEVHARDQGLCS